MCTEHECLAKALDMELRAEAHLTARAHFLALAEGWRRCAEQASWQDAYVAEMDTAL